VCSFAAAAPGWAGSIGLPTCTALLDHHRVALAADIDAESVPVAVGFEWCWAAFVQPVVTTATAPPEHTSTRAATWIRFMSPG
jgi:hypothetical protein